MLRRLSATPVLDVLHHGVPIYASISFPPFQYSISKDNFQELEVAEVPELMYKLHG